MSRLLVFNRALNNFTTTIPTLLSPLRMFIKSDNDSCTTGDHIERDPMVLNDLQYVDFSSSFSEENVNIQLAPRDSQDSFIFSDDEEILIAAAKHMSSSPRKTNHDSIRFQADSAAVGSPFESVKKLMSSPKKTFISPKKSTKRPAISPIQVISKIASLDKKNEAIFPRSHRNGGLFENEFDQENSPFLEPIVKKSPSKATTESILNISTHTSMQMAADVSKNAPKISPACTSPNTSEHVSKHSFLDPSAVLESKDPNITEINKKDIAKANFSTFSKPLPKNPLANTRNFSTKATNVSYPTIHLATQIPNNNEFPSQEGIKQVKPIVLSSEQEYILQQAVNGISLFYTGSAGTGKSVLLKSMIKALRAKHKDNVAVTASTGLAACNIGGITLHSFAGVGLAAEEVDQLLKKLRRNKKAFQRWLSTKVLIIDEISMVDGHLLNKLNALAKRVRKNTLPFGGIQVIACGDFYQLPPVVKKNSPDGNDLAVPPESFFSFECEAWEELIQRTFMLKEIFRQKGDQRFIDMLNEMRNGSISDETVNEFRRLSRPLQCPLGIAPAELFATRVEVDRANNTRLNRIPGNAQVFSAIDGGSLANPQRQTLLTNFLAPQQLYLKKNAQVMCIKNFDETLVNGSLGSVVDFMDKDTYMKACGTQIESTQDSDYIFNNSKTDDNEINNRQDKVETRSSNKTELENKERKELLGLEIDSNSNNKKYPLVRFLLPDGVNTRMVLVEPEQWKVEDETQNVLASRIQLPLILAWSLSIHKSQGQTLPKVKVDLKKAFETGQAYVALSRAVSREGLQVLNFDKYKVRSHPKVIAFYKTLESSNEMQKKPRGQTKLNFAQVQ